MQPLVKTYARRHELPATLAPYLAKPSETASFSPSTADEPMQTSPQLTPTRSLIPDMVRAFALVGIALVNVIGFSQPLYSGFFQSGLETGFDQGAFLIITSLFLMKSYPLFSMMFGAGMAWQISAAERAGADPAARYYRRMCALIILGLLHFTFFWFGDILIIYGLLGCLLFTMRGFEVSILVKMGVIFVFSSAFLLLSMAGLVALAENFDPEGTLATEYARAEAAQIAAFTDGSFLDVAAYRLSLLPLMLPSMLMQQGLAVFGFFCFGLAAAKSGLLNTADAPFWKKARRVYLPIGLVGNGFSAWLMLSAGSMTSSSFIFASGVMMAFSPFSALGYAGLIAGFCESGAGSLTRFISRAGGTSLTAYLLQSLLFSLIFTGYGFAQFGKLSAGTTTLIALGVGLLSLILVGIWRSVFPHGPVEIALRRFTYWGRG